VIVRNRKNTGKETSTSFLPSYGPNSPELNSVASNN